MPNSVSFNELLQESKREPVIIAMPDGSQMQVEYPTGKQIKAVREAMKIDDEDACIKALFGEYNADRLIEAFRDAPADFPARLLMAVTNSFGISPNLPTSSIS